MEPEYNETCIKWNLNETAKIRFDIKSYSSVKVLSSPVNVKTSFLSVET